MFESIVGPVKFLSIFLPKLIIDLLIQSLDALMSSSGNVDIGTIGTTGSNDARIAELKMNIVSKLPVKSKNIILFYFAVYLIITFILFVWNFLCHLLECGKRNQFFEGAIDEQPLVAPRVTAKGSYALGSD